MNSVATLPRRERAQLFTETAERMSLHEVIVEKDFWVCWLLQQLFTAKEFDGWLVFKGGTSLAKCFNLIQRFSEDIDLAVDYERLGFTGAKDPRRADLSYTKRQPMLDEMLAACHAYVAGAFLKTLNARIGAVLGDSGWRLNVSAADANTVEFEYPASLDTRLDYIRPQVVLELGTHAEPIPQGDVPVKPFAADQFPGYFHEPLCSVRTVVARRTFWEKATILHAEHHRPLGKPLLPRYSRHYADVAVLAASSVKGEALADLDLLRKVVVHKDRFYHCGWAKYLDARPGSFRLLPKPARLADLRRDHADMAPMFFGKPPSFDGVLDNLASLEREINSLSR